MDDLVDYVQAELTAGADPVRATQMAAYLKTDMPFYGVPMSGTNRLFNCLEMSRVPDIGTP